MSHFLTICIHLIPSWDYLWYLSQYLGTLWSNIDDEWCVKYKKTIVAIRNNMALRSRSWVTKLKFKHQGRGIVQLSRWNTVFYSFIQNVQRHVCPSIHASRLSKLFTMLQKSVRNSTIRLIVNQRFVERSKPVTQPLKKNNLPTFTSTNKKTVSKKKGENRSFEGRLCFIFAALHSKGVKYNLKS